MVSSEAAEERDDGGINADTTGTLEIPFGVGVDIVIDLQHHGAKQLQLQSNGVVNLTDMSGLNLFSGISAAGRGGVFRLENAGLGVAGLGLTELNGAIVLDLTPLRLMGKKQELRFHVANPAAAGAALHFQAWVLW